MDDIARDLSAGQVAADGVVLAEQGLVERADKVLSEGHAGQGGLLLHHLQPHIAGGHFRHVPHFGFAHDLAEEQQDFRLSVGERVAFDVVAVVVEVDGKAAAQHLAVAGG